MKDSTVLIGRKSIADYCNRSWKMIRRWIEEKDFPARKIDGVWESDGELIDRWRKRMILSGKEEDKKDQP